VRAGDREISVDKTASGPWHLAYREMKAAKLAFVRFLASEGQIGGPRVAMCQ